MRAGRLRHRVAIYRPGSDTANEYGETLGAPVKVESGAIDGNFWADITPVSGTETDSSRQTQGGTTHTIRMRYQPEITAPSPSWRVVYNARTFEVLAWAMTDERFREVVIQAREMVK